jgi:hypothetical protein
MQKPISTSAAHELVGLLKDAAARGQLVVVRTAPPPADARTPALLACSQLFGMSPGEGRALLELVKQGQASRETMHTAMSHDGKATSTRKTVDVVVSRMRRKLAPYGLEIVTVHGLGFKFGDGARDRIRRLIAEYDPKLVLESSRAKPKELHTE